MTLDKLNEIVPTCFITETPDSTTRNYRDVGPGPRGVEGRRGYNLTIHHRHFFQNFNIDVLHCLISYANFGND